MSVLRAEVVFDRQDVRRRVAAMRDPIWRFGGWALAAYAVVRAVMVVQAGQRAGFMVTIAALTVALAISQRAIVITLVARRPRMIGPHAYIVADEGLRRVTSESVLTVPWNAFTGVRATAEDMFVDARPERMTQMIPRRAFATPAEEDAFVAELRRRVARG